MMTLEETAAAAEREACAKIADELHASALSDRNRAVTEDAQRIHDARQVVCGYIAASIRARKSAGEER